MPELAGRFEQAYTRLRELAARYYFHARSPGSTLQPTALVHEVYLRMVRHADDRIVDDEHFLAIAATAMRQVMLDRARRSNAAKRGGDWTRVTLRGLASANDEAQRPIDVLAFDEVLSHLETLDARQAHIVELRVFAGMTVAEVARVLDVSVSTVEKGWRQARAWIRLQLQRADDS